MGLGCLWVVVVVTQTLLCVLSLTKYSGVLSNVVCSLTRESKDSDVDGENSDTVGDGVNAKEMLLRGAILG